MNQSDIAATLICRKQRATPTVRFISTDNGGSVIRDGTAIVGQ